MKKYKITLKHDNGIINIITCAENEQTARNNVLNAEGAPLCAIIKIIELKAKKTYNQRKAEAREKAISWQNETSEKNLSYFELMQAGDYFQKLAKKYGLIKEFKENGII